jgi:hypothetical protein
MYRQDQRAWKATDLLLSKHSPQDLTASGAHGWIVDEATERDVVRFIRDGANGPEVAFDVVFAAGAVPALLEPQNRKLTAEELAQYKARLLAAKVFDFRCTGEPANTIAFKDPTSTGWLVWVMSATGDPKVMLLGGHSRVSVSEDVQKDKLSKSCLILQKDPNAVASFFTNIVADTPLETHVFASLTYGVDYFEGTPDGAVWSIKKGSITKVN